MKLAALLLCLASTASADTKSWSAVKSRLGGSAQGIVSVDFDALRKAGSLAVALDAITTDSPQAATMLAMIKSTCQIDATAVVSDLTVAVTKDDLLVAVGFTGVDQTKVVDCATKVVTAQKAKLTVGSAGKVTTYSIDGKEVIGGAWIGKDIFVMASRIMGKAADSHAATEAFLAGKPVAGDIATYLVKADATKPLWFAVGPAVDKDVLGAYGAVGFASSTIAATAKIVTRSKDVAGKLAGAAKDKLGKRAKDSQDLDVAKVLNAVKVVSTTADIDVTVSVPDKDAKSAFKAFDKMF